MKNRNAKKGKFGISPSLIFLNLTIVLAVCIVSFLAYNIIKEDVETESGEPPFTPVTSAPESVPDSDTSDSTQESATDSKSDDSSAVSSEEESSEESSDESGLSTFYSKEFFDDALFIGDSITTGLSLYGFLDESKVFAQQGMAPSTAIDAVVNEKNLEQVIAENKPTKIYIMLGTNSVGYAEADYLADSMKEFIDKVKGMSSAKVYVLSIPPVTKEAEERTDNTLTKAAVDEYNTLLQKAVDEAGVHFVDLNKALSDENGYFLEDYAEMDGIHFMGDTYKVMLSLLETKSS